MNFRNIILLLLSICISSAIAMQITPATQEVRRNTMANRLRQLTNFGYDEGEILEDLSSNDRRTLQAHFDRIALTQEDPATAKQVFKIDKILFNAAYDNVNTQAIPNAQKILQLNNLKDKIKAHKKAYTQMEPKQTRQLNLLMRKIQRRITQLQGVAPVIPGRQLNFPPNN